MLLSDIPLPPPAPAPRMPNSSRCEAEYTMELRNGEPRDGTDWLVSFSRACENGWGDPETQREEN